jgi:hypothetical protein
MEKTIQPFTYKRHVMFDINKNTIAGYIGKPFYIITNNITLHVGKIINIHILDENTIVDCELNQQGKDL